jgi:hypothetical protein
MGTLKQQQMRFELMRKNDWGEKLTQRRKGAKGISRTGLRSEATARQAKKEEILAVELEQQGNQVSRLRGPPEGGTPNIPQSSPPLRGGRRLNFKIQEGRAPTFRDPPQPRGNGAHGVTRPTENRTLPRGGWCPNLYAWSGRGCYIMKFGHDAARRGEAP